MEFLRKLRLPITHKASGLRGEKWGRKPFYQSGSCSASHDIMMVWFRVEW